MSTLIEALSGVMDILGRAESNASGNPEFDYVGPRVAAARKALENAKQAPDLIPVLRRLAGNAGAFRAFEHEIRAVTGHTNWQCLMDAVADADNAIAKATGGAA